MHPRKPRQVGMTLIELMVTLAVALLLLLIAVPMFSRFTGSNQLTASSNALSTHLQLARSEAIKRGTGVTICASGDGATCAGTNYWELGWIVFVDGQTPGVVDTTASATEPADTIIAVYEDRGGTLEITSSNNGVRFNTDGTMSVVN